MNKKINSNYYTDRKITFKNHKLLNINNLNNYLFSLEKYKTKILQEDLPEYFVKLFIGGINKFVSTKNIKHIIYEPNYFTHHLYKDDFLFISYRKPITKDTNYSFAYYKNYDIALYGFSIINFIDAVEKYGDYDVKEIKEKLKIKKEWYDKNCI